MADRKVYLKVPIELTIRISEGEDLEDALTALILDLDPGCDADVECWRVCTDEVAIIDSK